MTPSSKHSTASRSLFPEPNRSMTLRVVLDAFDGNSDATQALWAALLRCFHEMCEPPGFDDAIEGIMRAHGKEPGGKLPGKPY